MLVLLWVLVAGILFFRGMRIPEHHPFDRWVRTFPGLTSYASPGLADLNGDGLLDVVLGAGEGSFVASDSAVLALDGRNGNLLWHQAASAELFGAPTFIRLNADTVPDVVLHGRRAQLIALDGATGEVIWRYRTQDTVVNAVGYARFNFYQPQPVPDQNGDQVADLVLTNGGNEIAPPQSTSYRYPGVLMLISGADGGVIAADTMPDGQETYWAPLLLFGAGGTIELVFGTGGEDLPGSLYVASMEDLLDEDLAAAQRLCSSTGGGFIGSGVLADLNGDGQDDVVAVAHHGPVFAIDGRSREVLWEHLLNDTRVFSAPVSGLFNGDETPDILVTAFRKIARGPSGARQYVLDGGDGSLLLADSLGCGTLARARTLDADGDGQDEVLLPVNSYYCQRPDFSDALHYLQLFDPGSGQGEPFYPPSPRKNIASTPWIGDLDQDGKMDVLLVQQGQSQDFFLGSGLAIQRLATDIPWSPSW